ncbi:cytochrome b/b6 domain-containing protein [Idiomarina sp. HP20-50]|uniref:cytochrome b/b6 domain-containing protein n=1 Tax=Idiomarina sp. HP20-50 TaxID=3070813 RepID=UPI00294B42A3|nr:cytochrome b/b6 domain-containing protein [Idiomarina sp. HP20-50]MDV6315152.1 cytochrome b/b6 domain-containing protein [Idiomarina sp. HP20-50]
MIIWDKFVRSFHWLLVLCFCLNYFFLEHGSNFHQAVGYTAAVLVVMRIVWGVIGPYNARFSSFTPSVPGIKKHLCELKQRKVKQEQGHNPLGGLMVFVILVLFLLQAVTGFLREEITALYGNSVLTSIHSISANTIFFFSILHIIAVIFTAYFGRVELIKPMISGKRRIK